MIAGVGGGEQVVGDAQFLEQFKKTGMKTLVNLERADALCIGADSHGRAVRIGAGDHQNAVAFQAVVAGKDIRRQVSASQVADMNLGIGIRPGNGDKDGFGHGVTPKDRGEKILS